MKKILIAVLAFAIAGGGLFAQGWTFNGFAAGGFGAFFLDDVEDGTRKSGDKTFVGPISDNTTQGFRAELQPRYTNADRTAGLVLNLRSNGTTPNAGTQSTYLDVGYGWLSFADNLITLEGGIVEDGYFNPLDRMHHQNVGGGIGVRAVLRPMDGLALGFGAHSAGNGTQRIQDANLNNAALYTMQVRYDDPNFRITAGFRSRSNVATNGFGNHRYAMPGNETPGYIMVNGNDDLPANLGGANPSAAIVSFGLMGNPDIHLALTALFMNIEEFGDAGDMRFYLTFGHTGLVEGLDLRVGASFGMTMVDEVWYAENSTPAGLAAAELATDDPSPHIWAWLSLGYNVTEVFIPRLDVHYVMGGRWNGFQRVHHWGARDGATFYEEDTFIQIRPAFRYVIGSSRFELGGIFNIDLGNDKKTISSWGPAGHVGANHGTNIGAYALMHVSF